MYYPSGPIYNDPIRGMRLLDYNTLRSNLPPGAAATSFTFSTFMIR